MKIALRGLVCAGVTLALSTTLLAKGPTTRITISGSSLTNPIEISDVNIIKEFQVWAGPGTKMCVGGIANCVEGTEGFIVDWSSGAVSERPSGLERYQISFYVNDHSASRSGPARLAYVVSYEYDSATAQGYVYLPGKTDQWYSLNTESIYRGREGNWFRAAAAWQDAVVPLIARQ